MSIDHYPKYMFKILETKKSLSRQMNNHWTLSSTNSNTNGQNQMDTSIQHSHHTMPLLVKGQLREHIQFGVICRQDVSSAEHISIRKVEIHELFNHNSIMFSCNCSLLSLFAKFEAIEHTVYKNAKLLLIASNWESTERRSGFPLSPCAIPSF